MKIYTLRKIICVLKHTFNLCGLINKDVKYINNFVPYNIHNYPASSTIEIMMKDKHSSFLRFRSSFFFK